MLKKLSILHHPLIKGTFILTFAGVLSRVIGFFYRTYVSQTFGEEGMGIYQLISPVIGFSMSICVAGYQTAISKCVAEELGKKSSHPLRPLLAGLSISLLLSSLCALIINYCSDFLSTSLLHESRTAILLRIYAFSLPFSAIHSCLNGYFYGRKRTGVPAFSQLVEQICRVGSVFLIADFIYTQGKVPSLAITTIGVLISEIISTVFSLVVTYLSSHKDGARLHAAMQKTLASGETRSHTSLGSIYANIFRLALPLTANRLAMTFLQSIETVSIPIRLRMYGYDNASALSIYGVLTGMAMPLIFFPNALTGSLAVLLLPTISEKQASGNTLAIKKAALRTVKCCFAMGFLCMCVFVLFGDLAGNLLFHSELAGQFICTLGFLCPFLYTNTTLSSILQGLGKASTIFVCNILCLLVRLCFVFFAIPSVGIAGYLWGILASQLILSTLYLTKLFTLLNSPHKH